MTQRNPLRVVQNVLHQAQTSEDARHRDIESAGLAPELVRLREFQCKRIANTYRDFAAQPQYAAVMEFFLSDLYGARDFTQRDHDAERLHNFLRKFFPAEMLRLASDALDLTRLSYALDDKIVRALGEMHAPATLTPQTYAEAYRRCNNYGERELQIELLMRTMRDAAETARMRLTGPALRLAKGPAHAAGWHEMYDFLERGQRAFAQVKKPDAFLKAIEERETKIMERIARGDKNPLQ